MYMWLKAISMHTPLHMAELIAQNTVNFIGGDVIH